MHLLWWCIITYAQIHAVAPHAIVHSICNHTFGTLLVSLDQLIQDALLNCLSLSERTQIPAVASDAIVNSMRNHTYGTLQVSLDQLIQDPLLNCLYIMWDTIYGTARDVEGYALI